MGLSWTRGRKISVIPFQFGNCQTATYIRGIAANELEARFLASHGQLVVVETEGQTQEIWGKQGTKVTKAALKASCTRASTSSAACSIHLASDWSLVTKSNRANQYEYKIDLIKDSVVRPGVVDVHQETV